MVLILVESAFLKRDGWNLDGCGAKGIFADFVDGDKRWHGGIRGCHCGSEWTFSFENCGNIKYIELFGADATDWAALS